MPTNSEVNGTWRDKDANKYLVARGDFNGDGIADSAKLLIDTKRDNLGLFVFLSQNNGKFKTYMLDEKKDINYLKVLGIAVVAAGRYRTACGKGYVDCKEAEPDEIFLQREAINYFKFESASMFFYWDEINNAFKGV